MPELNEFVFCLAFTAAFSKQMPETKSHIIDTIKQEINRIDPFNFIIDESDDSSTSGGMTNILYVADARSKPLLLDSIYLKHSMNAATFGVIIQQTAQKYDLDVVLCNGIFGDSTNYVGKGSNNAFGILIFAIEFPDPSHLLAIPIKNVFERKQKKRKNRNNNSNENDINNDNIVESNRKIKFLKEFFSDVYDLIQKAAEYFRHSNERKNDYKKVSKSRKLTIEEIKKILNNDICIVSKRIIA